MVNYFLLDDGTVSNLPPERYSARSISAVIVVNEYIPFGEVGISLGDTTEALEEMKYKGKRETLSSLLTLLSKASFHRASSENPV